MNRKIILILLVIFLVPLLASCGGEEKEEVELPEISEFAIEQATEAIENNDVVPDVNREIIRDAHIKVTDKGDVIIAIQTITEIPEEEAKEIGENAARLLAGLVEDLEGPSKDYLGEIYDYYNLKVGVGTDEKNFIVQGAKVKGAKKITW